MIELGSSKVELIFLETIRTKFLRNVVLTIYGVSESTNIALKQGLFQKTETFHTKLDLEWILKI